MYWHKRLRFFEIILSWFLVFFIYGTSVVFLFLYMWKIADMTDYHSTTVTWEDLLNRFWRGSTADIISKINQQYPKAQIFVKDTEGKLLRVWELMHDPKGPCQPRLAASYVSEAWISSSMTTYINASKTSIHEVILEELDPTSQPATS